MINFRFVLAGIMMVMFLTSCGESTDVAQDGGNATTFKVMDYVQIALDEIKVYQGTWDSNEIRISAYRQQTETTLIDGVSRTVYLSDHYNYNDQRNEVGLIYTSYEYEKNGEWISWKDADSQGVETIRNIPMFKAEMRIGDVLSLNGSSVQLLEASERVFPELTPAPLPFLKFKYDFGPVYFMVYYVKGYGEYVLKAGTDEFALGQKFLLYSENATCATKGSKPAWFDQAFPSRTCSGNL